MSKRNNVNPDHYKVAGRERPGNAVAKAPKATAELEEVRSRWLEKQEKNAQKKLARNTQGSTLKSQR